MRAQYFTESFLQHIVDREYETALQWIAQTIRRREDEDLAQVWVHMPICGGFAEFIRLF